MFPLSQTDQEIVVFMLNVNGTVSIFWSTATSGTENPNVKFCRRQDVRFILYLPSGLELGVSFLKCGRDICFST